MIVGVRPQFGFVFTDGRMDDLVRKIEDQDYFLPLFQFDVTR